MHAMRGPIGRGLMAAVLLASLEPELLAFGGKKGGGSPHRAAPHVAVRTPRPSRSAYHPPKFTPPSRPRATAHRPTPRPSPTRSSTKKAVPRTTSPKKPVNRSVVKPSISPATRPRTVTRSYGRPRSRYYSHRSGIRRYRGYGYSRRYATSNQNVRAIVQRLRSTYSSLARLDRGYGGHRVRAMSSISRAVRQLSHRSISRSRSPIGLANRNRVNGAIRPVSQTQSDARMRQAMRNLQGVHGVLTSSATMPSQLYARASVQTAMRHLALGLQIR